MLRNIFSSYDYLLFWQKMSTFAAKLYYYLCLIVFFEMKKLFAIISVFVISTFVFKAKAQLSNIEGMPPYKLGITAGLNMPYFSGSTSEDNMPPFYTFTQTAGLQIGANLMVDASPWLNNTFGRVELKYSQKGAYWENEDGSITENHTIHYIEIPIHYGYAWYINDMVSVMAEAGPYFAFGLAGREHWRQNKRGGFYVDEFSENNCNRFDFGLGLQASAMILQYYQVHIGYDFGLLNVSRNYLQNRNFSIGFTWFFERMFE